MLPLKAYILCEAARLIYRRWSPSLNWAKSCRCSWEKSRYPLMHLAGSQHLSRGICRRSNRLAVCKRPRCSSFLFPDYTAGGLPRKMREIMNRIRKMTNSTWAIHAASPATPLSPRSSAMTAMIMNIIVHCNIVRVSFPIVRVASGNGFLPLD